ncbi:hypothetical protein M569_08743, partial [Genlisea aurea]
RTLSGGLALLSSLLGSGIAKSLTYEQALEQSSPAGVDFDFDFDFTGVESFTTFAAENPAIVAGGVAVFAVPLLVSLLLGKPRAWGVDSARNAYLKLGEDPAAQLLDIRSPGDIGQSGSPDISGLKKKPAAVLYRGEDKPGFLKKLSAKFKEPENTTLFILDKFDGNSELVAELATANGFKAAYAIKDGAEGPRGWKNSNLPWRSPKKGFNLDFRATFEFLDDFEQDLEETLPVALGVAAAAGLGLVAFTEVDVLLQILGSAALVQFVTTKLLFAEDRKKTIQQFEEVLNTKVAPKELVGDIQVIGKALLPSPVTATSKALPAPAAFSGDAKYEESNSAPPSGAAEGVPEASGGNSVHKPGGGSTAAAPVLSPYPNYPDYKPPTSPIPSQP